MLEKRRPVEPFGTDSVWVNAEMHRANDAAVLLFTISKSCR